MLEIIGISEIFEIKNPNNPEHHNNPKNLNVMHYDPESNIISWEIAKDAISHARLVGNFIIHLSPSGKPVLIEMLDASKFVGQFDKIKSVAAEEEITPIN